METESKSKVLLVGTQYRMIAATAFGDYVLPSNLANFAVVQYSHFNETTWNI